MTIFRTDTGMQAFERAWADGDQYVTRVNRGALDVERHTEYLNKVYRVGFALLDIFEQSGNTVMVFERRAEAVGPQRPMTARS